MDKLYKFGHVASIFYRYNQKSLKWTVLTFWIRSI